jgi:hypothetical protein
MLLACALATGCTQSGLDHERPLRELDLSYFRCQVQPVLTASCAFLACHGNGERPLRIYAEQRFRKNVDWLDFEEPLSAEELDDNFRTVLGFIGVSGDRRDQGDLLSEKPLDVEAGGMYHGGRELYGHGDVFTSRDDSGYLSLRAFIEGESAADDCIPDHEVLP